jgi:hypothetical protein
MYAVTNIDDNILDTLNIDTTLPYDYSTLPNPPALRRSSAFGGMAVSSLPQCHYFQDATLLKDEELQHELSDNTETSYATQEIMSIMRSVSNPVSAPADDNV